MEMADAFTYRGIDITVVEFFDSVLTTVDPEFGGKVQKELESHGVRIATGIAVKGIVQSEDKLVILGSNNFFATGDMVLVAVGARPNSKLALSAGLETGLKGAIKVDHFMRTNVPDIFAAGDCVDAAVGPRPFTGGSLVGAPCRRRTATAATHGGEIV